MSLRAKEGLNEYDKESLGLLSALLVRDYRSDARIGIKALEILGNFLYFPAGTRSKPT